MSEISISEFEPDPGVELRTGMLCSVPAGFSFALVALVALSSLVVFGPLELHLPSRAARPPEALKPTQTPHETSLPATLVPSPIPSSRPLRVKHPHLTVTVPDLFLSDTLVHTTRPGESLTSIARHYLSHTTYLTAPELESAIRQANAGKWQKSPPPGSEVVIPGYETAPIVERPVSVPKDYEVRAIYLTGLMAGSRRGIELIRRWKELGGNAIVFDIKDMDGSVNVPFDHDLAPKQAHHYIENLPKFARLLHSLGLHGIARIAVFRDERLVKRHPELAVRSRRFDQPWRERGKLVWADPSRPEVQNYNLALAKWAATSGVDEIQFDYIRFPAEGDQKDTRFFFQAAHPEWRRSKVICDFLSRAYTELHSLGVLVSLDVFGVMAWQSSRDLAHTGQDIVALARLCDVLSPMIYPSHFFGMDGYARPGDAPEHFIRASMGRYRELTDDTGAVLRPWLQAFAWRTKTYSTNYILTQIRVAKENDGIGYLFWNARNDYGKPFVAMSQMRALPRRSPSSNRSRVTEVQEPPED